MPEANIITEHMEVVGSDGGHVGTVDAVEGERIKLTRSGSGDGDHHFIPTALVRDIKGNMVTLTATAELARLQSGEEEAEELPEDPQMGVATGSV